MSKTTTKNGRLCNQIIRNLSLSLLAKKYDLLSACQSANNFIFNGAKNFQKIGKGSCVLGLSSKYS